jgi:hypothetical protein
MKMAELECPAKNIEITVLFLNYIIFRSVFFCDYERKFVCKSLIRINNV